VDNMDAGGGAVPLNVEKPIDPPPSAKKQQRSDDGAGSVAQSTKTRKKTEKARRGSFARRR